MRLPSRALPLLGFVLALATLGSCGGRAYQAEGFSYKAYSEGRGGIALSLSRDYASIYGTWSAGADFGFVEGEARADGYVRLKLFAPGLLDYSLGTFEGSYAEGEERLDGRLVPPGGGAAREVLLRADPALTGDLAPARLRDTTRTGLASGSVEPTRFVYLGFEPVKPVPLRDWYRKTFQGGAELPAAMRKERDGFFSDFVTAGKAEAAEAGQGAPQPAQRPWYYEGRQFIAYRNSSLLVMGLRMATSTGEVLGESVGLRLAVIDPGATRLLGPGDFLVEGWEKPLQALIEGEARRTLGIDEAAKLSGAGFFSDELPPSSNFYVYAGGLGFHYNSWELGPLVRGGFWVNLPFDRLGPLLRPGILGRYGLGPAPGS